jgi:hypothetical protein
VQGCGAEILRLANIFLMECSIQVVCPVHDAFLVECPEQDLEDVVAEIGFNNLVDRSLDRSVDRSLPPK